MASALGSLNLSMTKHIDNEYGLGEIAVYTEEETATQHDVRLVKEFKDTKSYQRKIEDDTISDHEIFLIKLSFKPKKNDTFIKDSKTFFVDTFEQVTQETFRIYTVADSQTVPSPSKRYEI